MWNSDRVRTLLDLPYLTDKKAQSVAQQLNAVTYTHDKELSEKYVLEAPLAKIVCAYLDVDSLERVSMDYDILNNGREELWEIPKDVQVVLEFKEVESRCTVWGYMAFCLFRGKKLVIFQNASPLNIFYAN